MHSAPPPRHKCSHTKLNTYKQPAAPPPRAAPRDWLRLPPPPPPHGVPPPQHTAAPLLTLELAVPLSP
eukprot:scaffold2298_cov43-Phaeocystis_antarctica.AAC.2